MIKYPKVHVTQYSDINIAEPIKESPMNPGPDNVIMFRHECNDTFAKLQLEHSQKPELST